MKYFPLVAALLISITAFAQNEERMAPRGPHNVSVTGGFNRGGVTLGAEYEYMMDNAFGVGGHIRQFSKDSDATRAADGVFIAGVSAGHHFYKKTWDLSFTPGFDIISIDAVNSKPGSVTTVGPDLAIGLVCQVNSSVAVGFVNTHYWVWFDKNYAGSLRDDLSIKVRATF